MNEQLTLISTTRGVDDYGDPTVTETTRTVFCGARSVGMREFYHAHASGLKPEIALVLADYLDYNGEQLVEFKGSRYRVLRVYRKGQELELTLTAEINA